MKKREKYEEKKIDGNDRAKGTLKYINIFKDLRKFAK